MARTAKARVEITAKDNASGTIGKVTKSFGKFSTAMKVGVAGAALAAAAALRGLVNIAKESIAAFQVQEDAVNALNASLKPLGASADKVSKSLQAQASALQKSTTFGDEQIIQAQTLISAFVKQEDQIKAATAATLDFAVANGMDLQGAAALVAKTLGSSTNALTRYGVEITGAVGSQERLNGLVNETARLFGGRAAAETETLSGAVGQLSNAYGDLQEEAAKAVGSNEGIRKSIQELTATLQDKGTVDAVTSLGAVVVLFGKAVVGVVKGLGLFEKTFARVITATQRYVIEQQNLVDNTDMLEASARRHGITVEELKAKLEKQAKSTRYASEQTNAHTQATEEAAAAAKALAEAEGDVALSAEDEAKEIEKLNKVIEANAAAYDVAVESAKEFGVSTSVQLGQKLSDQALALELQKELLGANSEEFRALEKIAIASMDNLQKRIESLKRGQGDLNEEVKESTNSFNDGAGATDTYTDSLSRARTQANSARAGIAALGSELNRASQQARTTSADFDAIAASAGRAAAVSAGLAGGGSLTLGGTRINLPGHGSRLTTPPGGSRIGGRHTGFNISGGTFTTITNRA